MLREIEKKEGVVIDRIWDENGRGADGKKTGLGFNNLKRLPNGGQTKPPESEGGGQIKDKMDNYWIGDRLIN